jgi:hypothetical protein
MKISGFTFIRNGIELGYPFRESLLSLAPLCDEVVIAVGDSTDDTLNAIRAIDPGNFRIIETVWDPNERTHGSVLATQTNLALSHCTGDWCCYLQADEALHEQDIPVIRQSMQDNLADARVEGLLFDYHHFYGNYNYLGAARRWYRREIRIVRNNIGMTSWRDAQGFRIKGRKPRVRLVPAHIYHYGWVRPPAVMMHKVREFSRLWHSDADIQQQYGDAQSFDYQQIDAVTLFTGAHPQVMADRISAIDWEFTPPEKSALPRKSLRHRVLDFIETHTGRRLLEHKTYVMLPD